MQPIIETILTDQLRWFGHEMIDDKKTTSNKFLDLKVKGPRERLHTSWLKYINSILKVTGTSMKDIVKRALHSNSIAWRRFLAS